MIAPPILSILVPTFNRAKYLRECLDSLIDNSLACEILIGDNASSDDTEAVVTSYRDPRIVYLRHAENIGIMENHNFLLNRAQGKYVCIFGDDDIALKDNFELKIQLLEANPAITLVYSPVIVFDDAGAQTIPEPFGRTSFGYIGGRDEFQELMIACYMAWQTILFRRSVLQEVGPIQNTLDLSASHDWFWLQNVCRNSQTAYIHQPLVKIRMHPNSYTYQKAIPEGDFIIDRLRIWTYWLLEHPAPPIISNELWRQMAQVLVSDFPMLKARDEMVESQLLKAFAHIKRSYFERMEKLAISEPPCKAQSTMHSLRQGQ